MPNTYRLRLQLEKDGKPIPGLHPCTKQLTAAQSQAFDAVLESGGGDVALPIAQVADIALLLVQVDKEEVLKLGDITVAAGGLVLLWNATPETELINNDSDEDAQNSGLAAGT